MPSHQHLVPLCLPVLQRVNIGIALITNPRVLFLDEVISWKLAIPPLPYVDTLPACSALSFVRGRATCELDTCPACCLQPTSGLDSYTANEVMTVVKTLVKDGVTICATIVGIRAWLCTHLPDHLLAVALPLFVRLQWLAGLLPVVGVRCSEQCAATTADACCSLLCCLACSTLPPPTASISSIAC